MSKDPFKVRHIIDEDEDKRLLRPTDVEIPLRTLVHHCETREIGELLLSTGFDQSVYLDADFFLKLSDTPPKVTRSDLKLLFPVAIIIGVCIGILTFVPFYFGLSFSMFAIVSLLVFFAGITVGWVSSKKYRDRLKLLFEKAANFIENMRNALLGD